MSLSISILLALTVFFLLLSDMNPPTSLTIPLIGKYLLFIMIVVTMSITLTVYTLHINFKSPTTHKMSPWVKRIFTEILPRVLFMKRPDLHGNKVSVRSVNGGAGAAAGGGVWGRGKWEHRRRGAGTSDVITYVREREEQRVPGERGSGHVLPT